MLAGVMGYRFYNSGKFMPAGLVFGLRYLLSYISNAVFNMTKMLSSVWIFLQRFTDKKNIGSLCHLSLSFQFADDCPIWIQGSLTELIPTGNHQKTLLGVHHMYCFIKEIKKTNLIFVF